MPANPQEALIKAVLDQTAIEGLDIADALGRLNNSASIFMRIIHSFVLNTPNLLTELSNPTAQTLPDYAIKVHGCKGSLYGIGANPAGDKAKALEMASKASDLATVEQDNPAFIATVELLLERLGELEDRVQAATAEPEDAAPIVAAPDRQLLAELLDATQNYDMDHMAELIEQLSAQKYSAGGDDVAYLKEQYQAFAYELVEERLQSMLG